MDRDFKFADKVVLVTGSGTGIGQAIAKKFAENGATIILLGRRKEPLEETKSELENIIATSVSLAKIRIFPGVDVSDEVAITNMFSIISKEIGIVDILVNNAGVSGPVKLFTNSNFSEFKECIMIHLTGTFWTTIKCIENMKKGSKIITISTFFTEENKYEQRPYRFRTHYTSAQGAKNRLAEAFAWEFVPDGIESVATNPGPVHSDRIYKTVYPKAAAEFLRIGGFKGLTNKQIEIANATLLPYLGENKDILEQEAKKTADAIIKENNDKNFDMITLKDSLLKLLEKVQDIAEKIQYNTKKMIVDKEFLSQEDVAEMVYNLSTDSIGRLINGKIIPNDRVFYPVKPIINRSINLNSDLHIEGKLILLTATIEDINDFDKVRKIAEKLNLMKARQIIILTDNNDLSAKAKEIFKEFHHHTIAFENEDAIKRIYSTIDNKFGKIDSVIHFTGNFDYSKNLTTLQRSQWNKLVNKFINIPHLIVRESVLSMATKDALENPDKFKNSFGNIMIIGPDAPIGEKIEGKIRARSEVFRGALRPYLTTANQELHDVLNSKINLILILQGSIDGTMPDYNKLESTLINLCAQKEMKNNSIIYINE